jgi:ATP-binding cassette, subfamily D (ALD), peroxisomal long-chain fatty acid import protein
MVFGADAVERIMLAYKDISQLAGYTERVSTMIDVFHDLSKGKYQKVISESSKGIDLSKRGKVVIGDCIKFDKVPIVSPNGDVLLKELSLEIKKGDHMLITGFIQH